MMDFGYPPIIGHTDFEEWGTLNPGNVMQK